MSRTTHLLRRGNRWVYNRAYPKELWPILGKSPFRRAFNTESLAEANRARPAMDQEYWRTVDQARLSMAASASRPALALRDAEALAATWFRETLARQEERRGASSLDNLGDIRTEFDDARKRVEELERLHGQLGADGRRAHTEKQLEAFEDEAKQLVARMEALQGPAGAARMEKALEEAVKARRRQHDRLRVKALAQQRAAELRESAEVDRLARRILAAEGVELDADPVRRG